MRVSIWVSSFQWAPLSILNPAPTSNSSIQLRESPNSYSWLGSWLASYPASACRLSRPSMSLLFAWGGASSQRRMQTSCEKDSSMNVALKMAHLPRSESTSTCCFDYPPPWLLPEYVAPSAASWIWWNLASWTGFSCDCWRSHPHGRRKDSTDAGS